jgi:hypothetical protein
MNVRGRSVPSPGLTFGDCLRGLLVFTSEVGGGGRRDSLFHEPSAQP